MSKDQVSTAHGVLLSRWLASNRTDFSVYSDPLYILECEHSWGKSKVCVGATLKYFKSLPQETTLELYTGRAPSELALLDVYNGHGRTSLAFQNAGFQTESFSDCPEQVAFGRSIGYTGQNHTVLPAKTYDVVVSFEVLEHCKEPLVHLAELMDLVRPGGYLCESTGFGVDDQVGHFTEYLVNGEVLNGRQARLRVSKEIKKQFDLVFFGWGKMPRIWRKRA